MVRKHLKKGPREYEQKPKSWKVDPLRPYLRERWEQGVHNVNRLFLELEKCGSNGGLTHVRKVAVSLARQGPGECACALRDYSGRARADGLGQFRQPGTGERSMASR